MSIVFNRKLIYQRPSVCDLTKAPGVLSMFKPTRSYTLWSKKRQPPHSYPTRLLLVANIRRTSPKLDWVCSGWILVKLGIFMTRVDMAQTYQLHACAELAPRKYREPLYCIVIYCDPLLCWGHCCCKMYAYISSIVMTQHSIWIHGSHFSQLHCLQMAECLCSQITRVKARGPVGIWGWLAIKGTQACCNNYLEGWAKANFLEQTFGLWMKISDMGWASSSSFNKKGFQGWGMKPLTSLDPQGLITAGTPVQTMPLYKTLRDIRGKNGHWHLIYQWNIVMSHGHVILPEGHQLRSVNFVWTLLPCRRPRDERRVCIPPATKQPNHQPSPYAANAPGSCSNWFKLFFSNWFKLFQNAHYTAGSYSNAPGSCSAAPFWRPETMGIHGGRVNELVKIKINSSMFKYVQCTGWRSSIEVV